MQHFSRERSAYAQSRRSLVATQSYKQSSTLARSVRDASLMIALGGLLGAVPAVQAQSLKLEEVVVTAQKRSESLQDVPISMNAINSDQLEALNIKDFGDYVAQIPSISFTQRRPGQGQLFMRGISDGGNSNQ